RPLTPGCRARKMLRSGWVSLQGVAQPARSFNCATGPAAPRPAAQLAKGEYVVVEVVSRPQEAGLRPQFKDLREWIEGVDKMGQLRRVDGATAEEGIGLAQEVLTKHDGAPAVLFDNVPGYEPGFRVLACPLGSIQRIAYTLGLPPEATKAE